MRTSLRGVFDVGVGGTVGGEDKEECGRTASEGVCGVLRGPNRGLDESYWIGGLLNAGEDSGPLSGIESGSSISAYLLKSRCELPKQLTPRGVSIHVSFMKVSKLTQTREK